MSQFISKDNVHEATDVLRIRSLMVNAERLGEDELNAWAVEFLGEVFA